MHLKKENIRDRLADTTKYTTFFCERNIKVLGQNSPFLEGVDFFAIAKKDQGSVGS